MIGAGKWKEVYRLHLPFLFFLMSDYLPEVNLRYDKVSKDYQNQELIDIINKYVSKFGYSVNVL